MMRFLIWSLLAVLAASLITVQATHAASSFHLSVNLWEGKSDSGKVKVYAYSPDTHRKKSKVIDIGKVVRKSGDTSVENIVFRFTDKDLPMNGEFFACAYSKKSDKEQCENAERHLDAGSAVIWVRVPG
jgi:hypothetical protein